MGEQASVLRGLALAAVVIAALAYGLGDGGALMALLGTALDEAGDTAAGFAHAAAAFFSGGH